MFLYIEDGKISMMSADYVRDPLGATGTMAAFGFMLFGIVCLAVLLGKLVALLIRRIRKGSRKYTEADRQIALQQAIYGISGVIFALFILVSFPMNAPSFTAISGILAAVLAALSLANGAILCYHTLKSGARTRTKIKQYVWVILCVAYAAFIVWMQLYCFWKV